MNIVVFSCFDNFSCFQFLQIGILTSIQVNNKEVEFGRKGDEICVKIDPVPGEAPKMFARHFDETDMLVSKVNFHGHQSLP